MMKNNDFYVEISNRFGLIYLSYCQNIFDKLMTLSSPISPSPLYCYFIYTINFLKIIIVLFISYFILLSFDFDVFFVDQNKVNILFESIRNWHLLFFM